jgi:hypothetical protein
MSFVLMCCKLQVEIMAVHSQLHCAYATAEYAVVCFFSCEAWVEIILKNAM